MTLGEKQDKLFDLRNRMDEVNKEKSELQAEIDQLTFEILEGMEEIGVEQLKTGNGTISKKVELYPNIEDLDSVVKWAYETGNTGILQRRVSKAVFDEFYQKNGAYPDGINAYQKTSLSVRKSK